MHISNIIQTKMGVWSNSAKYDMRVGVKLMDGTVHYFGISENTRSAEIVRSLS